VVPSVFTFKPQPSTSAVTRGERAARRQLWQTVDVQPDEPAACDTEFAAVDVCAMEVGMEVDIDTSENKPPDNNSGSDSPATQEQGIQCSLPHQGILHVDSFSENDRIILYYTGFKNYEQFMLLYSILGPCVSHLPVNCHLKPQDQLFMTLIKLRTAKDDFELSILFDISEKVVSQVFICWLNFLFYQLSEIDFWPSRLVVSETMPVQFKAKFPTTRVIIDATEIAIQKPGHVRNQSASYSSYKNTNTMKVLVGCTPRGLVSFVSDAYGGSTSDRQICERSDLISKSLFSAGDSIMADRGFNVQDLFATKNVHVNIPSFLKGKSQLTAAEVVKDRRIASKRIHIERVIGLAKTFKILKQPVPAKRIRLGNRIIKVCFLLCNFKTSIVGSYA